MAKKALKNELTSARRGSGRGVFITFEGIEGCGKSTQSGLLHETLTKRGLDCVLTREPGGTSLGEKIRGLLLHSDGIKISDVAELFLFTAARSQIVREVIAPALKAGKVVICDRFSDATFSYQGYGGKVPLGMIEKLDDAATGGLKPDLTILLDLDTASGLKRAARKGVDRMELKEISYHNRVRAGYLDIARRHSKRIRVIRAVDTIEKTREAVEREVSRVLV